MTAAPRTKRTTPKKDAGEVSQLPPVEQVFAALQREREVRNDLETQVGKLYGENVELRKIVTQLEAALGEALSSAGSEEG